MYTYGRMEEEFRGERKKAIFVMLYGSGVVPLDGVFKAECRNLPYQLCSDVVCDSVTLCAVERAVSAKVGKGGMLD